VFGQFLKENTPKVLQSDNGGKFTNDHMKELLEDLNIKHITSLPYKQAAMGKLSTLKWTIKGMIMQYMGTNNSHRYLDVLPKIVDNYNNTYHTNIKRPHRPGEEEHKGQRGEDAGNPSQDQRCKHKDSQDWQQWSLVRLGCQPTNPLKRGAELHAQGKVPAA